MFACASLKIFNYMSLQEHHFKCIKNISLCENDPWSNISSSSDESKPSMQRNMVPHSNNLYFLAIKAYLK